MLASKLGKDTPGSVGNGVVFIALALSPSVVTAWTTGGCGRGLLSKSFTLAFGDGETSVVPQFNERATSAENDRLIPEVVPI